MTDKISTLIYRVAALVFWAAVYLTFLTPMELGDIWWHLKTGEHIWQAGALPESDPFSIISATYPFVLKAFWLAQILLYLVQRFTDFYGLIALKGLIFTGSFYLIHRLLKNYGVRPPVSYLLMIPMILIGTGVDEIRPQSFSFLFFSLSVYLLETRRIRLDDGNAYKQVWLLLPVMLVWSNIHAGYVSALGILFFYAGVEMISRRPASEKKSFLLLTLASLACSYVNPNGLQAINFTKTMFDTATVTIPATATAPERAANPVVIHEFLSIGDFTTLTGEYYLYWSVVGLITLGAIGFALYILKKKRVDILHLVIFVGLAYSAMVTFRAIFFFAIMGTAILGRNLSVTLPKEAKLKPFFLLIPATLATLAMIAFVIAPRSIIKHPPILEDLIPVKVSGFIEKEHLPGNIFHPYEWGGYLIWSLYPDYRVLTDGRNADFLPKQHAIVSGAPGWDGILSEHNINTAIYWPLMPYKGNVPPIVFALLKNDDWSPVYWDLQSIAFVRTPLAKKSINKNSIWELLQSLIMAGIARNPDKASNYVNLGELYVQRGLPTMAREAFNKALSLDPGNRDAKLWLGRQ